MSACNLCRRQISISQGGICESCRLINEVGGGPESPPKRSSSDWDVQMERQRKEQKAAAQAAEELKELFRLTGYDAFQSRQMAKKAYGYEEPSERSDYQGTPTKIMIIKIH